MRLLTRSFAALALLVAVSAKAPAQVPTRNTGSVTVGAGADYIHASGFDDLGVHAGVRVGSDLGMIATVVAIDVGYRVDSETYYAATAVEGYLYLVGGSVGLTHLFRDPYGLAVSPALAFRLPFSGDSPASVSAWLSLLVGGNIFVRDRSNYDDELFVRLRYQWEL